MKLYRGQPYGHAPGTWWTTNLEDARSYAVAGSARAWVVVSFEVDGRKIARYLFDRTAAGNTYSLPKAILRRHTLAVRIVDGHVSLSPSE